MTCAELDALCRQTIDQIKADCGRYDERLAIQAESRDTRTTTEHAIEALQHPDTSWGKHAVARTWLRLYEPHLRVFSRIAG